MKFLLGTTPSARVEFGMSSFEGIPFGIGNDVVCWTYSRSNLKDKKQKGHW